MPSAATPDPATCPLDDAAVLAFLDRALDAATHAERALLLAVAEAWIDLVGPRLDDFRRRHRHRPFVLLRDLDDGLRAKPLPLLDVRRVMADLPVQSPLGERVTACIIGVPGVAADGPAAPWSRVAGSR